MAQESELSVEEAEFHASKIHPSWEPGPMEAAATERALAEPSGARSPDTLIEPVDAVSADEVQISDEEPSPPPKVASADLPLAATKPSVSKPPPAKPGRPGKTRIGMGADVETPASPVVEPPAVAKTRPDAGDLPVAGAPRKGPGGTVVMDDDAPKKPPKKTPVTRTDEDAPARKSFGGVDDEVELPSESKGLGMKIGIGVAAVLVVGLGIKFLAGSSDSTPPAPTATVAKTAEAAPPPVTAAAPAPSPTPAPEATAAPTASAVATAEPSAAPSAVAAAPPEPEKKAEPEKKSAADKPDPPEKKVAAKKGPPPGAPAGGNKPAPAGKPGGGVIIKQTPF